MSNICCVDFKEFYNLNHINGRFMSLGYNIKLKRYLRNHLSIKKYNHICLENLYSKKWSLFIRIDCDDLKLYKKIKQFKIIQIYNSIIENSYLFNSIFMNIKSLELSNIYLKSNEEMNNICNIPNLQTLKLKAFDKLIDIDFIKNIISLVNLELHFIEFQANIIKIHDMPNLQNILFENVLLNSKHIDFKSNLIIINLPKLKLLKIEGFHQQSEDCYIFPLKEEHELIKID